MKFRKMMGCIALGLTCAMIGAGATMAAQNTSAAAEAVTAANSTTTVVTSPFTAAVQQVRNSVVGVSNYQTVRYGSYGNNFYFGYGFGYGNGRNNDQQIEARGAGGYRLWRGYRSGLRADELPRCGGRE